MAGQTDNTIEPYHVTVSELATATTMAPADYANWLNGNTPTMATPARSQPWNPAVAPRRKRAPPKAKPGYSPATRPGSHRTRKLHNNGPSRRLAYKPASTTVTASAHRTPHPCQNAKAPQHADQRQSHEKPPPGRTTLQSNGINATPWP